MIDPKAPEEDTRDLIIVVTTPKSLDEYKASDEYASVRRVANQNPDQVSIQINADNTKGLPEVYNTYIDSRYEGYYVCFIHDDLTLFDNDMFNKLQMAHKDYGMVGLAGATDIMLPFDRNHRTAWHTLSRFDSDGWGVAPHQSGFVAHQKDGETWSTSFGPVPAQMILLDGLFMSFDIDACLEKEFTFDERFKFHHYDLSASLRAYKYGLGLTTWDIFVVHKGMGEMDDSWLDSHYEFVKAYGDFTK